MSNNHESNIPTFEEALKMSREYIQSKTEKKRTDDRKTFEGVSSSFLISVMCEIADSATGSIPDRANKMMRHYHRLASVGKPMPELDPTQLTDSVNAEANMDSSSASAIQKSLVSDLASIAGNIIGNDAEAVLSYGRVKASGKKDRYGIPEFTSKFVTELFWKKHVTALDNNSKFSVTNREYLEVTAKMLKNVFPDDKIYERIVGSSNNGKSFTLSTSAFRKLSTKYLDNLGSKIVPKKTDLKSADKKAGVFYAIDPTRSTLEKKITEYLKSKNENPLESYSKTAAATFTSEALKEYTKGGRYLVPGVAMNSICPSCYSSSEKNVKIDGIDLEISMRISAICVLIDFVEAKRKSVDDAEKKKNTIARPRTTSPVDKKTTFTARETTNSPTRQQPAAVSQRSNSKHRKQQGEGTPRSSTPVNGDGSVDPSTFFGRK